MSLDDFHFAVNAVEPTLIRVGADEVTYNLHILIRFELERALLSGDLRARDLPGAWNEAYRHYLGVVPRDDAEGCLQDGHWAAGLFGYFPTYTLGNVFAAQLLVQARQELSDLDGPFARGDFGGLLGWLREGVPGGRALFREPADRAGDGVAAGSPAAGGGVAGEVRRVVWDMNDTSPKCQRGEVLSLALRAGGGVTCRAC